MIKNDILKKTMILKNMIKEKFVVPLLVIILVHIMKWTVFIKQSTTTKMES